MKTEKIKEVASGLEKARWICKCDDHQTAGGKIKVGDIVADKWAFDDEAHQYEIVLEPEHVPYDKDDISFLIEAAKNGAGIKHKGRDNYFKIVGVDDHNIFAGIGRIDYRIMFNDYEWSDGTPFGKEVK